MNSLSKEDLARRLCWRPWYTLPQNHKQAFRLWEKLRYEIIEHCQLLESDPSQSPLPLPQGAVFSYALPWFKLIMLGLRCASGDYQMNIVFNADLLAVRYCILTEPQDHDLLAVRRRRESMLLGCDGTLLTVEEAARRIVMTLTARE